MSGLALQRDWSAVDSDGVGERPWLGYKVVPAENVVPAGIHAYNIAGTLLFGQGCGCHKATAKNWLKRRRNRVSWERFFERDGKFFGVLAPMFKYRASVIAGMDTREPSANA
jgi:hypothetical protein